MNKSKFRTWLFLFIILIAVFDGIWLGYHYYFTGFGQYPITTSSGIDIAPPKFLWDWLGLLIVPVVLAVGGFLLNNSEENRKRQIAHDEMETDRNIADQRNRIEQENLLDRQREESLQGYIDKMTELLLNHQLKEGNEKIVADVARAKTLATVRVLDGVRKGLILKFLFDANLINGTNPVINLQYADFSKTEYASAYLGDVNLTNVDFHNAVLHGVEFKGAFLNGVNFKNADLHNGKIQDTQLESTVFDNTNLDGIAFSDSLFVKVTITNTDLMTKKSRLSNTIWVGCTFKACEFKDLPLINAQMEKTTFRNHTFKDVDFIKSRFRTVDFEGATFIDVDFSLSDFQPSNFSQASLYRVKFCSSRLAGADFSNGTLNKVDFTNAEVHFEKRTGEEQQPPDAIFTGSTFIDVEMAGAGFTIDQYDQVVRMETNFISSTSAQAGNGLLARIRNLVKNAAKDRKG